MALQSKIISWLITAMLCLCTTNLFAETKSFQEYLDIAKEAYDKEDYEEAIKNLLLANDVENNARLLFNIAKSYQKLNSCDKAIVYFMAFRRQSTAGAELRQQALEEIKKSRSCQTVKPLAGRFFIKSDPAGAKIQMDGEEVGTTPLEIAGYKSGSHEVTFTLEGHKTATRSFETLPGNDQLISQKLVPGNGDVKEDVVINPNDTDIKDETQTSSSNLVPIIIAGSITTIGAGVLGYAIYTDTVTIVDLKEERSKLDLNIAEEAVDSDDLTEDIDDAITLSLASYVVGGTLVAGGVGYLIYTLATGSDDEEDEVVIVPTINKNGYGINFSSTF